MKKKLIVLSIMIVFILAYGCVKKERSTEEKITDSLIGEKLTYYNIAGQPINFTISAEDIKSIEKTEIKGAFFWRVRVGESLAWDIYFDQYGKIEKKEQLFVT